MASLLKQHGLYYVQFYDRSRRPQRKRVKTGVRLLRPADRIRRDMEARFASGTFDPWRTTTDADADSGPKLDLTMDEAVAEFLESRSHRRPNTLRNYRYYLGNLAESYGGGRPVQSLGSRDILRWLDSTKANAECRRTYVRHVRAFTRYCVATGRLDHDVAGKVPLSRRIATIPRWLTPQEVDHLVDVIRRDPGREWLADAVLLAAYTGLRRGEILALRWSDVDLERRLLVVRNGGGFETKSGRDRVVPLADVSLRALRGRAAVADQGGLVFTHSRGRVDGEYCSHLFKRCARQAGLDDVNFHALRHSACSWLAINGAPAEAIRLLAGHSSVSVTGRYMHLSRPAFESVVIDAMNAHSGSYPQCQRAVTDGA